MTDRERTDKEATFKDRFVQLVAQYREPHGLVALVEDGCVEAKAQAWANTNPTIHNAANQDAIACGWQGSGQIVGWSSTTADQLFNDFMADGQHRSAITDSSSNAIGLGVLLDDRGSYVLVADIGMR